MAYGFHVLGLRRLEPIASARSSHSASRRLAVVTSRQPLKNLRGRRDKALYLVPDSCFKWGCVDSRIAKELIVPVGQAAAFVITKFRIRFFFVPAPYYGVSDISMGTSTASNQTLEHI